MTRSFTRLAATILHGMKAVDDAARDMSEKQSDEATDAEGDEELESAGTPVDRRRTSPHVTELHVANAE